MSDLLPNLNALLDQLTGDTSGKPDARQLAEAAASADTEQELDEVLAEAIATWRQA